MCKLDVVASPRNEAARLAMSIYEEALDAVRSDHLIRSSVERKDNILRLGDVCLDLNDFERVFVLGAGKASAMMAAAIDPILGDALTEGIVVTKDASGSPECRIKVLEAGHPIPDERSVAAGTAIHNLASKAREHDLVICLLSGGASALMELPHPGIKLEDLQTTTQMLLRAGATINELNTVRACLSQLKAGGLARAAASAKLVCLVISDVLGNPLEVIGSGPCVHSDVSPQEAMMILARYSLVESLPQSVRARITNLTPSPPHLQTSTPPHPPTPSPPHIILGDLWTALDAAKASAERRGLKTIILTGSLQGEAREVAKVFGGIARDLPRTFVDHGNSCTIAGGETTVTVRGEGKGGRSQELACAAAAVIDGIPGVALLAAGTDGTDGPTDAAGGLVDGETKQIAKEKGLTVEAALAANDSYPFLQVSDSLMISGPTHTNVGDLVIVVYAPA